MIMGKLNEDSLEAEAKARKDKYEREKAAAEKAKALEPVVNEGLAIPAVGRYEDLVMFYQRLIQHQQQTINDLTNVISELSSNLKKDDVVDVEVQHGW